MTKEEIISKELGRYSLKPEQVYHGTNAIPAALHRSMDEYAKQQAINFAKWTAENLWTVYGDNWYPYQDEDNPILANKLYDQFIDSQK
jgi:hypothetical protein